MVFSFAKAYREAQAAQGNRVAEPSVPASPPKPHSGSYGAGVVQSLRVDKSPTSGVQNAVRPGPQVQKATLPNASRIVQNPPKPPQVRVAKPAVSLSIRGDLELGWRPDEAMQPHPREHDSAQGALLDLTEGLGTESRELVMGLDFGTSCTKVVIDDRAMQQRYAVPLVDAAGVNAYLLPARLNLHKGKYTLEDQGVAFADLKLSLMANPQDAELCSRVCAYLALVIRSARAWLFGEHQKAFLRSNILWTLALGQPADQATSGQSKQLFEDLGRVAWALAASSEPLTPKSTVALWNGRIQLADTDDVEVIVMPELAAQIHGFVSSHGFDPRGVNIYLMVDVGAGTVDASIFRVKKDPAGTVSFSFFTNAVEAYGAANLHRNRVTWWQENLAPHETAAALMAQLEAIRLPTEHRGRYPDSFMGYVKGVSVRFLGGAVSPDDSFFKMVLTQVAGKVMFRAWKDNLLSQNTISGIPLFLCGGGARHPFYKKLEAELKHTKNASWMNAQHRELALPSDLIAPGVKKADYDRLSVAYGLSRLIPGQIKDAPPMMPVVHIEKASDWRSNYIDK